MEKEIILGLLPPAWSLSTENSPVGGWKERRRKQQKAVQRPSLRRRWELGLSFARLF
jgi:hypothetical protein